MSATHNTPVAIRVRDDVELMKQIATGGADAFEELYDRYCARAYRLALSICRDQGRAEDAVQEAFASIWRSRATYRPQHGKVKAWLLSVVRNRAVDVARRNGKHAGHRAGDEMIVDRPAPGDPAEQAVARDDAARLKARLKRLPDVQQEVIALAFYGQLSHTEIARELSLPSGTVKGRLRLGLKKLRADLDEVAAHQPERGLGTPGRVL